jgi:hypothetical protein
MHAIMESLLCIYSCRNSAPRGGYSGQGKMQDGGKETVNVFNAAKILLLECTVKILYI